VPRMVKRLGPAIGCEPQAARDYGTKLGQAGVPFVVQTILSW
jgi:hypothetical protein